jgi:3-hydroxyacyl-[acyl-carrier-protein] dehydratase
MPPPFIIDPAPLDFEHPIADIEAIRRVLPQRFEMEQLNGIVHLDPVEQVIVGFKEVRDDEFWVRGHMPGFPLLPGVLMCEAAAQLCSYYIVTQKLQGDGDFIAFGGLENVKFRGTVRPGDRLVMIARAVQIRAGRRAVFNTQGIVAGSLVYQGDVIGVPFSRAANKTPTAS